jgi:hypothetical protein
MVLLFLRRPTEKLSRPPDEYSGVSRHERSAYTVVRP